MASLRGWSVGLNKEQADQATGDMMKYTSLALVALGGVIALSSVFSSAEENDTQLTAAPIATSTAVNPTRANAHPTYPGADVHPINLAEVAAAGGYIPGTENINDIIQVGAFGDRKNAETLRDKMNDAALGMIFKINPRNGKHAVQANGSCDAVLKQTDEGCFRITPN